MKSLVLLAFPFFCISLGCQGGEKKPVPQTRMEGIVAKGDSRTHDLVIQGLEANIGRPYSMLAQDQEWFFLSQARGFITIHESSDFIYQGENTSCRLSTVSYPGEEPWSFFYKRSDGLEHMIRRSDEGEASLWECELWEESPSPRPPLVIFPGNGWSLFSQASALFKALGPGDQIRSGDVVEISWHEFSESIQDDISFSFSNGLSDRDVLKELRIRVDLGSGVPTYFGVYFENGNSTESTFSNFVFLQQAYEELAYELETRLGVSKSFRCECDFSEPNRIVKRRERVVPK